MGEGGEWGDQGRDRESNGKRERMGMVKEEEGKKGWLR